MFLKKFFLFVFLSILVFFIATLLYTYGLLGVYSRFMADDYCLIAVARDLNWLESIIYWYVKWHGAYSVTLLDEILPFVFPWGIPFIVPLIILVWVVTVVITLYHIFADTVPHWKRLAMAIPSGLVFLFSYFISNPDIPRTLYWWSGMRAYNLPVLFITIYILLYVWLLRSPFSFWKACLFGAILSFIIVGFGEVVNALFIVFFLMLVVFEFYSSGSKLLRKTTGAFLFGSAIGILIGTSIILSAPGNWVRQDPFPAPPSLLNVLLYSLLWFSMFLEHFLQDGFRVIGLIGVFLFFVWNGIFLRWQKKFPTRLPVLFFLSAFAFLYGAFIPSTYAMTQSAPERTISLGTYFFQVFMSASGFLLGHFVGQKNLMANARVTGFIALLSICMIAFSAQMTREIWITRLPDYVLFASEWDRTHEFILQAKSDNLSAIAIPPPNNVAGIPDPTEDPEFWVNKCFINYYGIEIVVNPPLSP